MRDEAFIYYKKPDNPVPRRNASVRWTGEDSAWIGRRLQRSVSEHGELAGYVDGYGEKGRFLAPSGPAPLPPSSLACGPCLAIPLLRHSDRIIATFPAHSHREVTVGFASFGGCVCGAFVHECAWECSHGLRTSTLRASQPCRLNLVLVQAQMAVEEVETEGVELAL